MKSVIIDVREKDEFDSEHVENSIHLPLSSFETRAPAVLRSIQDKPILILCRSGKRAAIAANTAQKLCPDAQCSVYEGGILEWKKQGNSVVTAGKSTLPIMRQVQIVAGALIVSGVTLSLTIDPRFIFISGFVGAGLLVAGLTGFCGMAELLARMPWNKAPTSNS